MNIDVEWFPSTHNAAKVSHVQVSIFIFVITMGLTVMVCISFLPLVVYVFNVHNIVTHLNLTTAWFVFVDVSIIRS